VDGGNILSAFTSSEKLKELVTQGRICRVRFSIKLAGHAFVGGSATAFIGLPNIDFSPNPKTGSRTSHAMAGGEFKAGLTATAGATLSASMDWKDHDDIAWRTISNVTGRAEGSAGIGIAALAQIEYEAGIFRVRLGAGAVAGIGGKLGVEVELSAKEGFQFVGYIMFSFDYHYAMEISEKAFEALVRIAVAQITEVEEVAKQNALKGKELVNEAFNWGRQRGIDIKAKMVQAISQGVKAMDIRNALPEAEAAIILAIMETPEEGDFEAILGILRMAGEHELKAILRAVAEMRMVRSAPNFAVMQGKALTEGKRKLLDFGVGLDKQKDYKATLKVLFKQKGIRDEN
jgi:hypothetical protein